MATITAGFLGGELKGVSGNAVFVRTARGTVVRDRTVPHNPMTPAQRAVREAQGRASSAWREMEPEAVEAWTLYANTIGRQPNNAFSNLYKVLLRLNPAAPVPTSPPSLPFFGDVISVAVVGTSTSVTFTSSAPNSPGIVTELLIQPLASRNRRTYLEKYRHAAFTSFAGGPQAVLVDGPGWYACAYRFVNANTGQITSIAELGVVRVG